MKLALLIVLAVLILVGAIASYYHFNLWSENRYDDFILQAADQHNVDPALVKALIKVQNDLNLAAEEPDAKGLLLVPPHVADAYLKAHGWEEWRYVCPNRHLRNHDPNKPEQFSSDSPGNCRVRGCGRRLVEEIRDPARNLEIGCWYLGGAQKDFQNRTGAQPPAQWLVIVYRWAPLKNEPKEYQKAFAARVVKTRENYLSHFRKDAR